MPSRDRHGSAGNPEPITGGGGVDNFLCDCAKRVTSYVLINIRDARIRKLRINTVFADKLTCLDYILPLSVVSHTTRFRNKFVTQT